MHHIRGIVAEHFRHVLNTGTVYELLKKGCVAAAYFRPAHFRRITLQLSLAAVSTN